MYFFSFFIASHKRFYAARRYRKIINTHATRAAVSCWPAGTRAPNNLWHCRTPSASLYWIYGPHRWPCGKFRQRAIERKSKSAAVLLFIGGRESEWACWTHAYGRTAAVWSKLIFRRSAPQREENACNTCSQAPQHVGEDARIISTLLDQRITKAAKNGINLLSPWRNKMFMVCYKNVRPLSSDSIDRKMGQHPI
jgi:hypothetical protein